MQFESNATTQSKSDKTRLARAMRLANRVMPKLSARDKVLLAKAKITDEWSEQDVDTAVWNSLVDLFLAFKDDTLVDYDQMFCEYPIDSFVCSLMMYVAFDTNFQRRQYEQL